jgi:hypothetical protein
MGPYDDLAKTYGETDQWIKVHGLTPAATMWECYLDSPGGPPNEQRTELWWPIELPRAQSGMPERRYESCVMRQHGEDRAV